MGSFSYTPLAAVCPVVKRVGSFSPDVGICLVFRREGSLSNTPPALMSCVRFLSGSVTASVMESVGSLSGWGGLSQMPRAKICLVVGRVWRLSKKSRGGNCLVIPRWGGGKGEGGSVTFTPRAAICHVFRRMARLSFKPNTEICVIGRSVNSLC